MTPTLSIPPRPVALTVIPENIPSELRALDRWVGWRYELSEKNKWTKPPFRINAPDKNASSTNPATWTSFAKALQAYHRGEFDGVGFVIIPTDRFVGGDIDHCIDPITGQIDSSALETVCHVATYWEVSASGHGLHFFGHATFLGGGRKEGPHELYKEGRFFTVTGHQIDGTPSDIREVQPAIDALYTEWFPSSTNGQPSLEDTVPLDAPSAASTSNGHSNGHHAQPDEEKPRLTDAEILITAAREMNGERFEALFNGRWAELKGKSRADGSFDAEAPTYPSMSEADLALCERLSYYTSDPKQMDSLFRLSKLKRPKWDEVHYGGKETYGAHTIRVALGHAKDPETAYTPPAKGVVYGPSQKKATGQQDAPAQPPSADRSWPEPPGEAAFAGLAGRFVEALLPHTEADPVALLLSFLVAFSIAVGGAPHCIVGATRHALRLFVVLVGRSAKARKGDSAQATLRVFSEADPDWTDRRVVSGLSSGEGLIWAVRDPIQKSEPVREKGHVKGFEIVTADPGESDKRLLVLESEFARVLTTMSRQGNTLSPVIRQAWDSGDLRVLTKTNAAKATGAHIGVIAHITEEELRRELSDTETVNGFANRLLFAVVRRSKLLPEPEPFDGEKAAAFARDVSDALIWSRKVSQIDRSPAAKGMWADIYAELSEERPGLFGALSARAEAHCLRLSAIYALLDQSMVIQPAHIDSALELWGYVDRSMHYLFGNATGDPIADTILAALRTNGEMTRTQISDLFGRHETTGRIEHALRLLLTASLALSEPRQTGGRPIEFWRPA